MIFIIYIIIYDDFLIIFYKYFCLFSVHTNKYKIRELINKLFTIIKGSPDYFGSITLFVCPRTPWDRFGPSPDFISG